MSLKQRIEELEDRNRMASAPLSIKEACKWYAMFIETNGAGHARPFPGYSETEWKWFKESEEKAIETMRILGGTKSRYALGGFGYSED